MRAASNQINFFRKALHFAGLFFRCGLQESGKFQFAEFLYIEKNIGNEQTRLLV